MCKVVARNRAIFEVPGSRMEYDYTGVVEDSFVELGNQVCAWYFVVN